MSESVNIAAARTVPTVEALLQAQGIPEGHSPDVRTLELARQALEIYGTLTSPRALALEIGFEDMRTVYEGDDLNAPRSVFEEILPRTVSLTLFAVTVGAELSDEIAIRFEKNDFAAAAMLDAAASCGAELTADTLQVLHEDRLRSDGHIDLAHGVLRFSPGYCGWHVSGQRRLFEYLRPEKIGIELTESCLMSPLKSISGVIAAAPYEVFDIDDTYPFCADCTTHSCRDRFAALQRSRQTRNTG